MAEAGPKEETLGFEVEATSLRSARPALKNTIHSLPRHAPILHDNIQLPSAHPSKPLTTCNMTTSAQAPTPAKPATLHCPNNGLQLTAPPPTTRKSLLHYPRNGALERGLPCSRTRQCYYSCAGIKLHGEAEPRHRDSEPGGTSLCTLLCGRDLDGAAPKGNPGM
ncbi:hypothetical protein K505DRAFT_104590 [Melanomma pulvis-pyrius CBS 109.77]|uniref:Uncharacterized protein n=1 Tax=Melanomma pulvis-pyrius CBS 109.77 TaxID=1314802 RepID=A0A6A6XR60_9PLEO|nr:hypothetical protein K505DRAFT_104590 [Melanomma pulvis-pyrius CBS 109.77]